MQKNSHTVFDRQALTAAAFLANHWQQRPCLLTDTGIDLSVLPTQQQLFALAAQTDVQSRIVYSTDGKSYQAIYDEPDAWHEVQQHHPTLLVSDIEKWHLPAGNLLDYFPFIKGWRFDDLMMSYAPKGASVGAHTDHYDVFLVQVQGTRSWSYDDQPLRQADWVEDSELAVLQNYHPQHTVELKAGDVLYLPPGVPHHGISTSDDCITCSIGLRAPSDAELLTGVVDLAAQQLSDDQRFRDGIKQPLADASVGGHEVNYLRNKLKALADADDAVLAKWFGQVVSQYRMFEPDSLLDIDPPELEASQHWRKSPFAVFAYHIQSDQATLMVNGEAHDCSMTLAQTLCDLPVLDIEMIQSNSDSPERDLLLLKLLIEAGMVWAAASD